jgi:hypothetical protein
MGRGMRRIPASLLLSVWCSSAALAHGLCVLGNGTPEQCAAELAAVFGSHPAFSATAHLSEQGQEMTTPRTKRMGYHVLGSKFRLEQDVTTFSDYSAATIAERRAKGTDRMVWIRDFGARTAAFLLPSLRGWVDLAHPEPATTAGVQKTKVGEETVDGHLCTRYRIALGGTEGTHEILTWEATDMDAFPVQVRIVHDEIAYVLRFTDVRRKAPAARLFTVPADYRRYDRITDLMAAGEQRAKP